MADDDVPADAPAPERKSFLRKIFSQAEPAPSKKPRENPLWRPQSEAVQARVADGLAHGDASESPPPSPAASDHPAAVGERFLERRAPDAAAPERVIAVDVPAPSPPPVAEVVHLEPVPTDAPFAEEADPRQPIPVEQAVPSGQPFVVETVVPPSSAEARSWWRRLRDGLARSSSSIGSGIGDIFTKRRLDAAMLEELEDVLIRADLGVATASRISDAVGRGRYDRDVAPDEVKAILAAEVERVLAPCAAPFAVEAARPFVVLVVGVNGSGKTTTIGKLAAKLTGEGKRVTLVAGDTFRAAAIAQLRIWGERLGCPVVAREQGSDAAGLAYEAIEAARADGADVLLMDTAGRLQNRAELMAELEKIIRVMRKLDPGAPHAVLLVLDATVGQNAMSQVEIFGKVAGVTGLVMTKLDGTARGGILVAVAEKFRLPVHFIGVGETAEDLEPFAARDFAEAIAGLPGRGAA